MNDTLSVTVSKAIVPTSKKGKYVPQRKVGRERKTGNIDEGTLTLVKGWVFKHFTTESHFTNK